MTDVSGVREPSRAAIGWTVFASIVMITIGFFHMIVGLVAILDDEFYLVRPEYVFRFDTTTWGWIHILIGLVILASGFALFSGAVLARTVGVIMAMISAVAGFAWLPWYPVWGVVIIAIAVSVIWALTVHGRDMALGSP